MTGDSFVDGYLLSAFGAAVAAFIAWLAEGKS